MEINLPNGTWKTGSHITWKSNFTNTIEDAVNRGMYSFQIFMGNPKSYERTKISKEDINTSLELLNTYPVGVFSHFPYIANLCWSIDDEKRDKLPTTIKWLEYELGILSHFPINGVVLHPGSCPKGRKEGLDAIIQSINTMKFEKNSNLLLENSAGQGNSLAVGLDEIKTILNGIDEDKINNVNVCIDTAHLYGAGNYDLSKCEEIERLFEELDEKIGMNKVKLFHLNDSAAEFGSRKDRHELIGEGLIWTNNLEPFILLMNKCSEYEIHSVLETNPSDYNKLCKLMNNK